MIATGSDPTQAGGFGVGETLDKPGGAALAGNVGAARPKGVTDARSSAIAAHRNRLHGGAPRVPHSGLASRVDAAGTGAGESGRVIRRLRAAAFAAPLLAAAPAPASVTQAADLFGARLGQTRVEVRALMPANCVEEAGSKTELFLTCGARKLSAGFTAGGKVWWLTASYDMTNTQIPLSAARAALAARFGKPAETHEQATGAGTLGWLPPRSRADAGRCLGQVALLTAQVELGGAAELPSVEPGCLPLRSATLAEREGHRGLIVQEQDPRARIAELAR